MKRWIIVGALAAGLALAGCSSSDETSSTPTTKASASSNDSDTPTTEDGGTPSTEDGGSPTATYSLEDCLGVATANLGLISGNEADAERLKSYDPPDDVQEAADLLVAEGGIQITGENQDETVAASETVTAWVEEVCPS